MWHPDPDQLALAALPAEEPDPLVSTHLASCPLCRGQVESLHRTVELARENGDAVDDGAGPPDRVWQAISHELDIAEPGPTDRPPEPARSRRRIAVAALAAVAGLLVGLVGGYVVASTRPAPDAPATVVARLAPIGTLDPTGSGRVAMVRVGDVGRMEITLSGVTNLAGGDYLEVWLLDPAAARLVSLGGLTREGSGDGSGDGSADGGGDYVGIFTVPAGLPFAVFSTVDVSVERFDGDPSHSQRSILRGQLLS